MSRILFALVDSLELDGKIYALGDEISADTNPAVIAVMRANAVIGDAKPSGVTDRTSDDGLSVGLDSDPRTIKAIAESDEEKPVRTRRQPHPDA